MYMNNAKASSAPAAAAAISINSFISLLIAIISSLCRSQLKNQSPFNDSNNNNNRCNMLWYFCAFAASLHCKYVNRVRGQAGRQSPKASHKERERDRQLKYEYTHIFAFISLLQLQSAATTASCCGCATVEGEGEGGRGCRQPDQIPTKLLI